MVVRDGSEAGGDGAAGRRKPVNGRAKGAKYELDLAAYFVGLGYENARRMIRTGTVRHADEGDLDGLPFTVQAKTQKGDAGDAQLSKWKIATAAQRVTRGHGVGLLIVKRNGHGAIGSSWVHLPLIQLAFLTGASYHRIADCTADAAIPVRVCLDDLAPMLVRRYPPS